MASLMALKLQAQLKYYQSLNICRKSTKSGLTSSVIVGPHYYCTAINSGGVEIEHKVKENIFRSTAVRNPHPNFR